MSTIASTSALVVCHGVSVVHGHGDTAVTALKDVELSIDPSDRVGLCGRSGSGKTTLLHVLGGLTTPSHGDVLLGGTSLSPLDAAARGRVRARSVAYVFQGANLLPTFTAFENVAFSEQFASAEARLGAAELLELVGLGHKLDALPAELSGGEAQRVAIARALAQQPELLLCDEPTGQLDSETGSHVLDLIDALQERLDFALVIATHDTDVAARARRIVTLEDGQILSDEELDVR